MDYGPFGFIEKFSPLWNMWIGGGEHFGFLNQTIAGHKNFLSLVDSIVPLLDENGITSAQRIGSLHADRAEEALDDVWRRKMGLIKWTPEVNYLKNQLISLLEMFQIDYTIFWRELAQYPERYYSKDQTTEIPNDLSLLDLIEKAFYEPIKPQPLVNWLLKWLSILHEQYKETDEDGHHIAISMRLVSPKYILREWMLAQAYTEATKGSYETLWKLQEIMEKPYEEQQEMENLFYRRASSDVFDGLGLGGVAFMSCSS